MSRPLRVLLIEDSPTDAALLVRELRRAGYEPDWERVDSRPALQRALSERWEVILCDFTMPGLDALSAVSLVRGQQIDTPVIIVSGTVGEEHAVAALRSGAQDFVLKQALSRLVPAIERELRDSETRVKHARAENTLKATEASFRAAFELIPDGVLVARDGLLVHANGPATTLLGASRVHQLLDRPMLDLFAPSDRVAVAERLRETESSTGPVPFGELAMLRLDGQIVGVETTAMSVHFEGRPAILSVVRDIAARREIVARAMHIDRMLAVGTLAAGVGHEINNPLAYVIANLAFARDQLAHTRRRYEAAARPDAPNCTAATELAEIAGVLSEVEEGARRIRDIARDLNTFARDDEELRPVDLRTIADSALRMAAPEVRQRARLVREYADVPPVEASPSRLSQVFLNLVVNAAQSIAPGAYEANEVTVRIRKAGTNVVVEVADTGSGISPEHRERLFTPFFTTKPVGQGTGLGLSISWKIVRSFGGTIEVDSAAGRGTVMRVVLPAVIAKISGSAPPAPATASRGRLLFVDDERLIGNAFQRALSRDHDVVVVQSAVDALARLTGGEAFDLILCDVNMPVMTGIEFYERVAATLPDVARRIVMITGGGEQRTRAFAASRDVPLLEKPLDIDQVRALLAQTLEPLLPPAVA